ncbi:MAG: SpoIIE family protein phosphatase [Myxococcales bacterium]|nr:SpoIIE family protein phosphatase [Myxococcota bacterium]MDW8283086.1 SpoIIE family protein phosphatase [Myxococcales bacterium]
MKLSIKLGAAMTGLVAAVTTASVLSIGAYLRREVERQLAEDLDRTAAVLEEVQRARLERLISENRVVADEPRLKAVVNSTEIDEQTVQDTAIEMREVARSDLFVLMGPDGSIRANVSSEGKPGPVPPPGTAEQILAREGFRPGDGAEGADRREFHAAWVLQGELYLCAGHVVTLSGRPAGILLTGDRMDDRMARKIRRQTNTELVLLTHGRITAAAIDEHLRERQAELAAELMMAAERRSRGSFVVTVSGRRYLAQMARIVGLAPDRGADAMPAAFFVMLRSLDEAMQTYHQIRRDLVRLGLVALGLAALAALLLASTLTRRVARLAEATATVAAGDLDIAVPVGGSDEIGTLARCFNDMIAKLRISREELRSKERLEREMEIATVIQTLLLPAQPSLDGFEVAARMVPAEEVGGDFYDLHQGAGGGWVAIGDVSGHGVTSGLIMMMVQSMLSALARRPPEEVEDTSPRQVLQIINAALYDNLRVRMHDDNYMTMVLLQHRGGGRFRYAGAHESLLVHRCATGVVESLPTDGTWLGLQEDIGPFLEERKLELHPGDTLLLYTDGVTEAKSPQGVQFDVVRLREVLQRCAAAPRATAERIRDGIIEEVMAWSRARQDDVTVLVLRRLSSGNEGRQ